MIKIINKDDVQNFTKLLMDDYIGVGIAGRGLRSLEFEMTVTLCDMDPGFHLFKVTGDFYSAQYFNELDNILMAYLAIEEAEITIEFEAKWDED